MLVGTFFLGCSDVLRRKYLVSGIDDQAMLVLTLFLTGTLTLPVFLITGLPEIQNGFWPAFWATVILNIISQNIFIKAFKLNEVSLVAPLRLITPPLVIISGILVLGEIPSLPGIIGIFITMLGLFFLLLNKKDNKSFNLDSFKERGVIYGLVGSILFAASFPFDKIIVVKSSAIFAVFSAFTAISIFSFFINIFLNKGFYLRFNSIVKNNFKPNLSIAFLTSFGTILTNQALNYSLAAYGASLKRLAVLWTVILSGKFLKEKNIEIKLTATIIMFVGILISIIF